MILTDKCKADFEKWLRTTEINNFLPSRCGIIIKNFHILPFSMQYGVIVDFADSADWSLMVSAVDWSISHIYKGRVNSRHEARTEAVKKFNEIYNQ